MTTPDLFWTPPQGHADIAPSRHKRVENDGYLTIDARWIVPARAAEIIAGLEREGVAVTLKDDVFA
jgi:hypothetical protein